MSLGLERSVGRSKPSMTRHRSTSLHARGCLRRRSRRRRVTRRCLPDTARPTRTPARFPPVSIMLSPRSTDSWSSSEHASSRRSIHAVSSWSIARRLSGTPYVLAQFDCSYTTTHCRVRRAAIKPIADHGVTRTALARGHRLIRWAMRAELGENGLRLRPGEIAEIADLDSYRGFDDGWAQPEEAGIWTEGSRSTVTVDFAGIDERAYALIVSLGPVCAAPDRPLNVELLVNGSCVAAQSLTPDSAGLPWRVGLPSRRLANGSADLTFVVAEPRSPLALEGSLDNRTTGIFIRTMQLEQARPLGAPWRRGGLFGRDEGVGDAGRGLVGARGVGCVDGRRASAASSRAGGSGGVGSGARPGRRSARRAQSSSARGPGLRGRGAACHPDVLLWRSRPFLPGPVACVADRRVGIAAARPAVVRSGSARRPRDKRRRSPARAPLEVAHGSTTRKRSGPGLWFEHSKKGLGQISAIASRLGVSWSRRSAKDANARRAPWPYVAVLARNPPFWTGGGGPTPPCFRRSAT